MQLPGNEVRIWSNMRRGPALTLDEFQVEVWGGQGRQVAFKFKEAWQLKTFSYSIPVRR